MEKLFIATQRLEIRNLKLSDIHEFHIYRSNPDVTKYQGFEVMSIKQAEDFIKEQLDKKFGNPGEWVQYGIESKVTGKIIGDCAIKLQQNDARIAEIGITISPLHQRMSYAKEVHLGILEFLFSELDIHRVVETVDAENIASINLLKSTGFRLEGHFIDNVFFKGKWSSELQFAMLKREWDERST